MKKTKIIIPALGMLLLSTAASITGTVAWFAMNTQVTATGMTVSAKSDSTDLIIVEGSTFDSSATSRTVTSTHAAEEVYPVAPATTLTAANIETASSWHYAYSSSNTTATKEGDYIACTSLTDYVVSETFSIGLSAKSGNTSASNLRVTNVTLPANTGISCVLTCGSNICGQYEASAEPTTNNVLAASVTTAGVVVKIYYYINGDDANVYTNNIAALHGAVSFTFKVGD